MAYKYTINKAAKFYQVISRNADVNGNPYRLVILYDAQGLPVQVFESRSSSPNVVYQLLESGVHIKMLEFHLQPSEYNRIKKQLAIYASVENGIEFSY